MNTNHYCAAFLATMILTLSTGVATADIYRWVDKKTGEIVFAETPPPPEVTTEYENITPKLEQRELSRNTTEDGEPDEKTDEDSTSDATDESAVLSDQELLLQHRCQNFTAQIDGLELRITETYDADEMDRLVLKLAEYEKKRQERCPD